ncbi:hypothetical protein ACI2KR_08900 [Pseudomonas luteola]
MKPSPDLDVVIFTILESGVNRQEFDLDMLEDRLSKVASDVLGFEKPVLGNLKTEVKDLIAVYGPEASAEGLWNRTTPELEAYLQTSKDTALKPVHIVNPGDKDFTRTVYAISMPFGNFSATYGVYADNEQDALDVLADYETERLSMDSNISILRVDESTNSEEEIAEMEEAGEYTRLGNDGVLCDVSTVMVEPARLLTLAAGLDIEEHLENRQKARKNENTPTPGM